MTHKPWLYGIFAIALVLSTLFSPPTAYAQEIGRQDAGSESFEEPLGDAITVYAKSLDLSYDEAQRRLDLQNQFGFLVGELYEREPTYGGGWIEHEPDFRLGVYFSSADGEERLRQYAEEYDFTDQIYVAQSPYSFKELEAIASALSATEELQKFTPLVGLSMREAKIIISVEDPAEFVKALQPHIREIAFTVKELNPERIAQVIRVEYGTPPVETASWPNYYGGYNKIYSDTKRCSAGLALKKSDGSRYASTAKHCQATGYPFTLDGHDLGDVVAYGQYNADMVVMDAESEDWTITNKIRGASGDLTEAIIGHKTSSQLPNGTYVVHRGTTSGFALITITGRTSSPPVTDIWGTVPNWLWPPGRPAVCLGDSGGAVFQVVGGTPPIIDALGVGIESWGFGSHPTPGCFTTMGFQPVDVFPSGYLPLDSP